jgi:hypothetical protein
MKNFQIQSVAYGLSLTVLLAVAAHAQASGSLTDGFCRVYPAIKAPSLTPTLKIYPTPVVKPRPRPLVPVYRSTSAYCPISFPDAEGGPKLTVLPKPKKGCINLRPDRPTPH